MKAKFFLICLAFAGLLSGCGGQKDAGEEALTSYTFLGDTIPALEQVLTEQTGGRLVTTLSPSADSSAGTSDGASSSAASSAQAAQADYISYDYQQFNEGQAAIAAEDYAALLTDSDNQLQLDGDADYQAQTGSVLLYRQAVATDTDGAPIAAQTSSSSAATSSETGNSSAGAAAETLTYADSEHSTTLRLRVRIDWTPTSCLVTLDNVEGQDFSSSLLEAGELLSCSGAKTLMESLQPAEIGLPGQSMSEYSLKPGPGFVMVDGQACLSVYIYGTNDVGTNSLMGTYFISSDGSTLYRQTGENSDEVERIPLYSPPAPYTGSASTGGSSSGQAATSSAASSASR